MANGPPAPYDPEKNPVPVSTEVRLNSARPPIQLSMPRHRLIPGGSASSPTITVDPVVVVPDTASNTASVNDKSGGPSMNGNAPNSDSDTQMPTVSTKA